jgi:hypothetical protein
MADERAWHYVDDTNATRGPVSRAVLLDALRTARAGQGTLVWTEGMADWEPADRCALLQDGAPLPAGAGPVAGAAMGSAHTHPWRRLFARYIDVFLLTIAFTVLFAALVGFEMLAFAGAWLSILILLLQVPIEALLLSSLGTTPGKALYGIGVAQSDGTPPPFDRALKRAFLVYLKGMGLGIPIVSLVTIIIGYRTLTRAGQASWDADTQLMVHHRALGAGRIVVLVVVWVIIAFFLGLSIAGGL